MSLTYFIVDDEKSAIKLIELEASKIADMLFVGSDTRPVRALERFKTGQVIADLAFVDIHMSGMTGLELTQTLIRFTHIVVVTGDRNYALEGYRYGIEDYIEKPINFLRLKECVDKVREKVHLKRLALYGRKLPKLNVKSDGKTYFLNQEDIQYFESLGNYVKILTNSGKQHLMLITLTEINDFVSPRLFMKIHRSIIVNIEDVLFLEGNEVTLTSGVTLQVADSLRTALIKRINL